MDKSNRTDKYSAATFTQNYGIPTFIDDRHAIAHNKIIIIDGQTVLTGSFNFTKQAEENNAENLLVIEDTALAKKYRRSWKVHFAQASLPTHGRNAAPAVMEREVQNCQEDRAQKGAIQGRFSERLAACITRVRLLA